MTRTAAIVHAFTRPRASPAWLAACAPVLGLGVIAQAVLLTSWYLDLRPQAMAVPTFAPIVFAASIASAIQIAGAVAGRGRALPGVLHPIPVRTAAFAACVAVTAAEARWAPIQISIAAFAFVVWQVCALRVLSIGVVLTYLVDRVVELPRAAGAAQAPPTYGIACGTNGCVRFVVPPEGPGVEGLAIELAAVGLVAFALGWRGLRARLACMGVTPVEPLEIVLIPVAIATLASLADPGLGAANHFRAGVRPHPAAIAGLALAVAAALLYLGAVTRRRPTAREGTPPGPPSPPS